MPLLIALSLAYLLGQSPAPTPASISGQVLEDITRAPIAGAEVTLHPMSRRSEPPSFGEAPRMVSTDGNGRYTFQNVEPGRYRINVQKAGFTRLSNSDIPGVIVVSGEPVSVMDVTLQRGAVVMGRVLDEDGQPIANVNVTAMRRPPQARGTTAPADVLAYAGGNAQTDDLGEFRLHSLPPGELYVQAMTRGGLSSSTGAGATTMVPTYFPSTADPAGAQPLNVAAGQTIANIDIRMIREPAFQVSGVVVNEGGRPVTNARVTLRIDSPGALPRFMMSRFHESRTDTSGRFSIGGVTSGTYTLLAMSPVVIAQAPARGAGRAWSTIGGSASGAGGNDIMTETRNGTTIEYRGDTATRVPLAIGDADISGLQIVVQPTRLPTP